MIKYILIALILGIVSVFPKATFAQQKSDLPIKQTLRVSPIILDVQLKKGQNNFEINIDNLQNQPLGINANAENFDPLASPDFSLKENPLVTWTSIENQSLLINPQESKKIGININVPKNAKDGGYFEVVFFTPIIIKNQDVSSPTVLQRVGVLVLGNIGKINYNQLAQKVKIENFNKINFVDKLPLNNQFEVKNSYFSHFSAKPFLTLRPLFGRAETIALEEKHILPGQTRSWIDTLEPKTKSIFYKADLAVSVGNGKQIFADSYYIVFPIKKAFVFLGLVFVLFFALKRRKQMRKALSILVKGK